MLRHFWILFLVTLCSQVYAQVKIAVLPIQVDSLKISEANAIALSDYLSVELMTASNSQILYLDDVRQLLEHQAAAVALGCAESKCLHDIGKALDAEYLVTGNLGLLGDRYIFTLKLIESQSAKAVSRVSEKSQGDLGFLTDKIPSMVFKLLKDVDEIQKRGEVYKEHLRIDSLFNQIDKSSEKFVDARDANEYGVITIGSNKLFSKNLNFESENSLCYDNLKVNCERYGRLYTYKEALEVCPTGWHLPSEEEWVEVFTTMAVSTGDSLLKAKWGKNWRNHGFLLKAKSGWNQGGNGRDVFGFSALPAGRRTADGSFYLLGEEASWWTSTQEDDEHIVYWSLLYNSLNLSRNILGADNHRSVRCFQN